MFMKNGKKKVFTLFMLLVLLASILSGCKGKAAGDSDNKASTAKTALTETPEATTAPAEPTAVPAVEFTDLGPQEITAAMNPGWNLGNQLEASSNRIPSETAWSNPVIREDLIKTVKAAGFQSIRIPISYLDLIGEGPDYTINAKWLDRVQEVVDYVVNNDLYAVINIHGDGFQSVDGGWLYCDAPDQDTVKAKFKAVWTQIATRFKDYDEHLIFEDMNEISDMSYADAKPELYEVINSYNQLFLDTIRQTGGFNDRRWVLIPGWNTDIEATAREGCGFAIPKENYLSDLVSGASRIMISVHDYSPWDFCGGDSGDEQGSA
jgi:endoglucanase